MQLKGYQRMENTKSFDITFCLHLSDVMAVNKDKHIPMHDLSQLITLELKAFLSL